MQIKLPALDCLIQDQSTSELHKDIYNIGKEVKGSHFELDTSLHIVLNWSQNKIYRPWTN